MAWSPNKGSEPPETSSAELFFFIILFGGILLKLFGII
jgi:hypothetical protein